MNLPLNVQAKSLDMDIFPVQFRLGQVSYIGSPRFTQMEKTAHTTFSDGDKYPMTKEVQLLLTLRLVSIIVTGCRLSTQLCFVQRTRKKTSKMSWRRGCRWTTWFMLDYRFLRPYYISIISYCFVPIRIDARLLVYKFSSLVFRRLNHSLLS